MGTSPSHQQQRSPHRCPHQSTGWPLQDENPDLSSHALQKVRNTGFTQNEPSLKSIPEEPKREASSFRSLGAFFWLGLSSTARKRGGRPYRRMLSTKSRMAQMWIQALKACCRQSRHLQQGHIPHTRHYS